MRTVTGDIAVLGSGFAGSLTSLILDRIGLRPILIEREAHPRFAIGESSTPTADLVLKGLAEKYGLPALLPLCKYGSWQEAYPNLGCGIKRGFSYFQHRPGEPFVSHPDHRNELLVAASSRDDLADTHWLRSDVDQFLVNEVRRAGIPYFDRTQIVDCRLEHGWTLHGEGEFEPLKIQAAFVIDATGAGGLLPKFLDVPVEIDEFETHSRALFGHFRNITPWHDCLRNAGAVGLDDHPFNCDHAALHHLIEGGWMWQLRFNNGVTSAGFVLDTNQHPLVPHITPSQEWQTLLARYPSIAEQFQHAELVAPTTGLIRTGRLQRRVKTIAGHNWALLPGTAGFIDPLHSTGIAHSLCGIERLMHILATCWGKPDLSKQLAQYAQIVQQEFRWIDRLVAGCYAANVDFRLFTASSMLYFAAATTYEHRRLSHAAQGEPFPSAFLCADDTGLIAAGDSVWQQLQDLLEKCPESP